MVCIERLLPVVGILELGGRYVADRLEEPAMVEPVDPLERRELGKGGGRKWYRAKALLVSPPVGL